MSTAESAQLESTEAAFRTPSTTRVSKPDHVLVQVIDDESALLNVRNERYFTLDDVGTRMWTVLIAAATVQEAQDLLLAEFDVEPRQLQNDLYALIRELAAHDLVCLADAEVAQPLAGG